VQEDTIVRPERARIRQIRPAMSQLALTTVRCPCIATGGTNNCSIKGEGMRHLLIKIALVCLAGCATAQTNAPEIKGTGDWGAVTNGLACRITTDRDEYTIPEPVTVLVEVRNAGRQPVTFGWAEVHLSAIQGDRANPPYFFSTTMHEFPETQDDGRPRTLGPGEVWTRTVVVKPWGPTMSSIPSVAGPGKMTIDGMFVYRPDASARGQSVSSGVKEFMARR
jgi:hypothetical protein